MSYKFKMCTTAVYVYQPSTSLSSPKGALEVMEGVFNVMDILGSSPPALNELIAALFRKAAGGRRPI
eukprot:243280-Pyramimonas_sp.AAC.1